VSAIEGFVPRDVTRCFNAYLDFCYIARASIFTQSTLDRLDEALESFRQYRKIFQRIGVRDPTPAGFSLPRQHAMAHYRRHIENFGAPNGLCSSITESKHISAVKRPWRRSSRYNAINQMMQTNCRAEKLTAARAHFTSCGMLNTPTWQPRIPHPVPSDDDEDQSGEAEEGAIYNEVFLARTHGMCAFASSQTQLTTLITAPNYPHSLHGLGQKIGHPNLPDLVRKYLLEHADAGGDAGAGPDPTRRPLINVSHVDRLKVFHSARAIYCAPSNPSTTMGMYHETIRATPTWNRGEISGPRYDCIFVSNGSGSEGSSMSDLLVARVLTFFSFTFDGDQHQCALVHWYSIFGDQPDPDNGMWVVTPDYSGSARNLSVIHIDSIFRAAHLLPIFDATPLPRTLNYTKTLDSFQAFYVNKYIDYHAYETIV